MEQEIPFKTQKYKFLFWEMILCVLTFALGLYATNSLYLFLQETQTATPQISVAWFLGYFFVGTIMILAVVMFLKRKKAKKGFYKTMFIIGNLYGTVAILPSFLALFLPIIAANLLWLPITIISFWMWFKKPTVIIHNFLMILGLAGVSGNLGLQLNRPELVAFLLAILAIYDFIAVYKTKHMVKMVESMIESETIIGLIIPFSEKQFLEPVPNSENRRNFVILGGGDVAIPLMLAASFIPQGWVKVLIVSVFALIGIALSFLIFFNQKEKEPVPALPAVSFFSLIGCLIAIIL